MKSIAMAVIFGTLAWIGPGAPTSESVSVKQKAESELLQIHLGELEAHRKTDVEALLANAQDGFVYLRDGKISRTNVSDTRESFRQYQPHASTPLARGPRYRQEQLRGVRLCRHHDL